MVKTFLSYAPNALWWLWRPLFEQHASITLEMYISREKIIQQTDTIEMYAFSKYKPPVKPETMNRRGWTAIVSSTHLSWNPTNIFTQASRISSVRLTSSTYSRATASKPSYINANPNTCSVYEGKARQFLTRPLTGLSERTRDNLPKNKCEHARCTTFPHTQQSNPIRDLVSENSICAPQPPSHPTRTQTQAQTYGVKAKHSGFLLDHMRSSGVREYIEATCPTKRGNTIYTKFLHKQHSDAISGATLLDLIRLGEPCALAYKHVRYTVVFCMGFGRMEGASHVFRFG